MESTKAHSNITAKVVADSISPEGIRITTMQLHYPRFIHAEVMTHRMFSRNASSSRAIPARSVLEVVKETPAMPVHWGKNQAGMQAQEELDLVAKIQVQQAWLVAMDDAAKHSEFISSKGCHKQIVNRITEPFQYINVIVTATEYENFFWLRNHQDAQPEIKALAEKMYAAREDSCPTLLHPGEWHLPFVVFHKGRYSVNGAELTLNQAQKVSASACAQVSYRKNDLSLEKAEDIWQRLIFSEPMHASPVEHQATPINFMGNWRIQNGVTHEDQWGHLWSGNFRGWIQFRKTLTNEAKW
jgi:thymidylate synthase ThyX